MFATRFVSVGIGLVLLVTLGALGCASTRMGNDFKMEATSQLVTGRTTEAESISLVGSKPTHRQTALINGNPPTWEKGDYFLGWRFVRAAALGNSTGKELLLMFNSQGVLKEIVRQGEMSSSR